METYTTGTGQAIHVHGPERCSALIYGDTWCVIHRRKRTHMLTWPTHWRSDWGGFMEVICPHGIGHPAPEETRSGGYGHGCDGCCQEETEMSKPMVHTGAPGDEQTYLVRQGGLMRCCLITLEHWRAELVQDGFDPAGVEGQVLPCDYCSGTMIFVEGAWEWNKARTDYTIRETYKAWGIPPTPPEAERAP